jgi:hypothetical protein
MGFQETHLLLGARAPLLLELNAGEKCSCRRAPTSLAETGAQDAFGGKNERRYRDRKALTAAIVGST